MHENKQKSLRHLNFHEIISIQSSIRVGSGIRISHLVLQFFLVLEIRIKCPFWVGWQERLLLLCLLSLLMQLLTWMPNDFACARALRRVAVKLCGKKRSVLFCEPYQLLCYYFQIISKEESCRQLENRNTLCLKSAQKVSLFDLKICNVSEIKLKKKLSAGLYCWICFVCPYRSSYSIYHWAIWA